MATSKPTAASSWREKSELVELPSGKRARLRQHPNIYAMLRSGVLTTQMLADFYAAQQGELDDAARAMGLQDALVAWSFIEPRCVIGADKVPAGAIHIDDIGVEDVDFLVERAFGGTPDDGTFRGEPGSPDAGGDGAGVADEPEPDPRPAGGKPARVRNRPPPSRAARNRAGAK